MSDYAAVEEKPVAAPSIDRLFFRRLWRLLRLMLPRLLSQSVLFTLALVALIIGNTFIVAQSGKVPGLFYNVILSQNAPGFVAVIFIGLGWMAASAVMDSCAKAAAEAAAVGWRRELVHSLQLRYFRGLTYYKVTGILDNAEQRITQDAERLTQSLGEIAQNAIAAPFTIVYYVVVGWLATGWIGPVGVTVFFIIGFVIARFTAARAAPTMAEQERLEGVFRDAHQGVRSYAETIALVGGQLREFARASTALEALIRNRRYLVLRHWVVFLSSNIIAYFGAIVNYLIIGLAVFALPESAPSLAYGSAADRAMAISNTSFALLMLASGFSQIVNVAKQIGDVAGYTARVAQLAEALDEADDDNEAAVRKSVDGDATIASLQEHSLPSKPMLSLQNVSVYSPEAVCLIKDLNLDVYEGTHWRICGVNGSGKTSLLRALRGLWSHDGTITWGQRLPHVLVVPQRPFMPTGTLTELICWPADPNSSSEIELQALLGEVGLASLSTRAAGFNAILKWNDVLSPGEQQRVACARILHSIRINQDMRPVLLLLDEADAALDLAGASELLALLQRHATTMLISHRLHDAEDSSAVLTLTGQGGWQVDTRA